MNIVDLVDNLHPVDYTVVLGACMTDRPEFCSPSMSASGEMMLNDMIECQDLISALYYADKMGMDFPKLQARLMKTTNESWSTYVQVEILSPVSEEFFELYSSIQDGNDVFGLKEKFRDPKYKNMTFITQTKRMEQFQFSPTDCVNIINTTQKQR